MPPHDGWTKLGGPSVLSGQIAEDTGLDHTDAVRALLALSKRYLDVAFTRTASGEVHFAVVQGVTAAGLEATGRWPSAETAADRFIAALDRAIDETPEGSPKASRLRTIRDNAVAMSRDVLVDVMGAVLSGRIQL